MWEWIKNAVYVVYVCTITVAVGAGVGTVVFGAGFAAVIGGCVGAAIGGYLSRGNDNRAAIASANARVFNSSKFN